MTIRQIRYRTENAIKGQQRKLNVFRYEHNELGAHESLDMSKPGRIYVPSSRPMPSRLLPMEYPDR